MKRDFEQWLDGFRTSIADYSYYVDFDKVYADVDALRIELNILNSLVGVKDVEGDFNSLVAKYPEVLRCVPILLAKRDRRIHVCMDNRWLRLAFGKTQSRGNIRRVAYAVLY